MKFSIKYVTLSLILLIASMSYGYDFQFYAIDDYGAVGLPGNNLTCCCQEGYYFYWAMAEYGNNCDYWCENGNVSWINWATEDGYVNGTDFAYYAGHGGWNGPVYGNRAMMPLDGCSGEIDAMNPSYYDFGAKYNKLKWIAWSACSVLYDGTGGGAVNWDALSRYFRVFQGLHTLLGHRAFMTEGTWTVWTPGFWPWEWADSTTYNSGLLARYFVVYMYYGCPILSAWFSANNEIIYGRLHSGFEAAAMCAEPDSWDSGACYPCEAITSPHGNYSGSLSGFYYYSYRHGTPTYG